MYIHVSIVDAYPRPPRWQKKGKETDLPTCNGAGRVTYCSNIPPETTVKEETSPSVTTYITHAYIHTSYIYIYFT